ncbi:general transcription factor 3C polypeptide 6-like isoform X2 [Neltuma alba]|uniref:general transcription factor 3C polypeptide 6-like isoform X2 n=1 Tax=Neltuma alba TaxID=207710 RepID=UPI0010A2E067|nr:general transcription factor 3C polypeptide 6-like isoform X2 [Prosopis alba]
MDTNVSSHDHQDQEEYVLLDLDSVSGSLDIPPNAKYVLTGLNTLNPLLIIDDKLKLVGEYEETIGTCIVFTEEGSCFFCMSSK